MIEYACGVREERKSDGKERGYKGTIKLVYSVTLSLVTTVLRNLLKTL